MLAPSSARTARGTMTPHQSQPCPGRCLRLVTMPLRKVPRRPQGRNSRSSVQGSQRRASRATMNHESRPWSFQASRSGARYSFSMRAFRRSLPPSVKAIIVPQASSRTSIRPKASAPSRAPARRNVPRQMRNTRLTSRGRTRPRRPPASVDRAMSAKPARSHSGAEVLIHPRYRQMPPRVRMEANNMSLPESRGSPMNDRLANSTNPAAKAVRRSFPVARASPHVSKMRNRAARAVVRGSRRIG